MSDRKVEFIMRAVSNSFRLALLAAFGAATASAYSAIVFFPNRNGQEILKFDSDTGAYMGAIGAGFIGTSVTGCEMSPIDGYLYVSTSVGGQGTIMRFDPFTGAYAGQLGTGFLIFPDAIVFDDAGMLYVTDLSQSTTPIMKFVAATGEYRGMIGAGFIGSPGTTGMVWEAPNTIWVTGANGTAIQKFKADTGEYQGAYGSGFFTAGRGLELSASGKLLIGSLNATGVMKFDKTNGAYSGMIAAGFCPVAEGTAMLPDGKILVRTSGSGTEYVCRFNPDTGAYAGLFANGYASQGYDLAVEKPAQVCGTISLQNWSLTSNVPAVVEILDATTLAVLDTQSVTPDNAGAYCVTTFVRGNVKIAAKSTHWLRKINGTTFTIGRTGPLNANFSLINGDIDGNNEVGLSDYGLLSTAYGTETGDPGYNFNADLDGNGEVGLSDYGILSTNYGLEGD